MAPRVAPSIALNVIISLRGRALQTERNLPDIVVHTQVWVSFATVLARKVAAHAHTHTPSTCPRPLPNTRPAHVLMSISSRRRALARADMLPLHKTRRTA